MRLTALALGATLTLSSPALAQEAPARTSAPTTEAAAPLILSAPDGRQIPVRVWPAATERGVIVFSHGLNGSPEAYDRILSAWAAHGFTVLAPLHPDSLRHTDHARYDNQAAFIARLTDLAVARGYASAAHAGRPLVVAGHSFGSLMSLIAGGAVTAAGPMPDPSVRGVIAFSSAGDLPGLVTPETYAALDTPLLMITGDADVVPGFVTDWTAHRSPFDRSPAGDKLLMVFAGGTHELVGRADAADFDLIVRATSDFLEAHALNDAAAAARLAALTNEAAVTVERR